MRQLFSSTKLVLFVYLLLFHLPLSSFAGDATKAWTEAMDTAREALVKQEWEKAAAEYEKAMKLAAAFPAIDPRMQRNLNNLAMTHFYSGNYVAAEPLLFRAWKTAENVAGAESEEAFIALTNLGDCYAELGKYGLAEDAYRRAWPLALKSMINNANGMCVFGSKFGAMCQLSGKTDEALQVLEESHRSVMRSKKDFGDPRRVPILLVKSRCLKPTEAEKTAVDALDILCRNYGKEDLRIVPGLVRVAECVAVDNPDPFRKLPEKGRRNQQELIDRAWICHAKAPEIPDYESAVSLLDLAAIMEKQKQSERAATLVGRVEDWLPKCPAFLRARLKIKLKAMSQLTPKLAIKRVEPKTVEPAATQTPVAAVKPADSRVADPEHAWRAARYYAYQETDATTHRKFLETALATAEQFGERDIRLLNTLDELSEFKALHNPSDDALTLCKRLQAMSTAILGAEHSKTIETLARQAYVQQFLRGDDAEPTARKALADAERLLPNSPKLSYYQFNLALVLTTKKKITEAEQLFKKGMEGAAKQPGICGFDPESILSSYFEVVRALDMDPNPTALHTKYSKWREVEKRAIEWRRTFRRGLSEYSFGSDFGMRRLGEAAALANEIFSADDSRLVETLQACIQAAVASTNFPAAIKCSSLLTKAFQTSPPKAIDACMNMVLQSDIALAQGDLDAAEIQLTEAQKLVEANGKGKDPIAAEVLSRLVKVQRYQGRLNDALTKKNLELHEQLFGKDDLRTAGALGEQLESCLKLNMIVEAEGVAQRIAAIPGALTGRAHNLVMSRILEAQGNVLLKQQKFADAAMSYQNALIIIDQEKGVHSPSRIPLILNVAVCQKALNKSNEAETSLLSALRMQKRAYGEGHSKTIAVLEQLLGIYKDLKKSHEVAQCQRELDFLMAFNALKK